MAITVLNLNRILKFVHCWKEDEISYETYVRLGKVIAKNKMMFYCDTVQINKYIINSDFAPKIPKSIKQNQIYLVKAQWQLVTVLVQYIKGMEAMAWNGAAVSEASTSSTIADDLTYHHHQAYKYNAIHISVIKVPVNYYKRSDTDLAMSCLRS